MSTATQGSKPTSPALRVPPEEKYWKKYSPHGEAPLSLAGSIALHLLCGGLILFLGLYAASWFSSRRQMPVEPIRLDLGGGGGKKSGVGGGKGVGEGGPREDTGREEEPLPGQDDVPPLPKLSPIEARAIEEKFDPDTARIIMESKSESARAFAKLDEDLRKRIRPTGDGPVAGAGKGGSGSGGGKGTGDGTGEGSGKGVGKAKLNAREKRMLRWHMRFTARTGAEYLAQLRSLGAILAFPTGEGYMVVRDLRPGGRGKVEDISSIQRIYWIDDKPFSVRDILAVLGMPAEPLPPKFIAFMPEELEKKLFDMEKRYVTGTLRLKWDEDRIDETNFRAVPDGRGGFRPELVSVSMKK
jgi:hypothetical protein